MVLSLLMDLVFGDLEPRSSREVSGGLPSFFFLRFSSGFGAREGFDRPICCMIGFHGSDWPYRISVPSKPILNHLEHLYGGKNENTYSMILYISEDSTLPQHAIHEVRP